MSQTVFDTPIDYLKGVGPDKATLLKTELNIHTFGDFITYFPFRYVDKTKFYKLAEISPDMANVQVKGIITDINTVGSGRASRLSAQLTDETGSIELVWFQGVRWVRQTLKPGAAYVVFGKPNEFKGKISISHPETELITTDDNPISSSLDPVYSTTEKLSAKWLNSKGISRLQRSLLETVHTQIDETLSQEICFKYHLIPRKEALISIHFPQSPEKLQKAQTRLKFEELFFIQLEILRLKIVRHNSIKGFVFNTIGDSFNTFYSNHLPFELTNAQKRVVKEIRRDLALGKQMNRLLQGDVGSGKTMVALLTILIAIDNGYQCCLMTPTEILASQHYETIHVLLEKLNINVALLTGSSKKKKRTEIHEKLKNGELNLIIGTHALLEDTVQYKNLGLAVIDEQHRFGVAQRATLWRKNDIPPHILVMTATPIPRTLAMTLYGDLDVSVIDELPPGRKPIKTIHRFDSSRLGIFNFMKEEIAKGRQIYIVYPLIEESEKLDYKDLTDGYESICRAFPLPHYAVSIVHGRMKPADKDYEMNRFAKGETQILVATTVIEVGVNVPNASVMVIESAERFGLSQLHQLRGRVGRGADQSYCLLITSFKLSADSRLRMNTMVKTNDGFEIAEVDLKLRGPGDLSGTQQSGVQNMKIADLVKDTQLMKLARIAAEELLETDTNLSSPENKPILQEYIRLHKGKTNWSRIS